VAAEVLAMLKVHVAAGVTVVSAPMGNVL